MNTPIIEPYLAYLAAAFLSLAVGHHFVVGGLRVFLDRKGRPHRFGWGVGIVERAIYTSCIVIGLPIELIGGWLVLKGLVQFKPRKDENFTTDDYLNDYYGYLVGTGLSLIVGVGVGLLGRYLLGFDVVIKKG